MLPLDVNQITDEPVILGRDLPIEKALRLCLKAIPSPMGVNNHMGSLLTQRPNDLRKILKIIQTRRLRVLDSRTTEHSQLCRVSQTLKIPCVERDVFLDNTKAPDNIRLNLRRAAGLAKQRGWAIAIGHPSKETVDVLLDQVPMLAVRILRLSEVRRT